MINFLLTLFGQLNIRRVTELKTYLSEIVFG
jgi:hypothetical protein